MTHLLSTAPDRRSFLPLPPPPPSPPPCPTRPTSSTHACTCTRSASGASSSSSTTRASTATGPLLAASSGGGSFTVTTGAFWPRSDRQICAWTDLCTSHLTRKGLQQPARSTICAPGHPIRRGRRLPVALHLQLQGPAHYHDVGGDSGGERRRSVMNAILYM